MCLIYIKKALQGEFEVVVTDRDTLEWSVRYRFDMNRIRGEDSQTEQASRSCIEAIQAKEYYAFNIMCVVERGEKEEDLKLVLLVPGKVISYNFKDKTLKVLYEFPSKDPRKIYSHSFILNLNPITVFPNVESLAYV